MAALDTNVLVRWLTDDNAEQCVIVQQRFAAALTRDEPLSVPVTVLLEMEWVLRSRYRLDRESITAALDALLSVPQLDIMDEPAVEQAVRLFKQDGAPDFADCLHIGLASEVAKGPLVTFDERAATVEGATLLEA